MTHYLLFQIANYVAPFWRRLHSNERCTERDFSSYRASGAIRSEASVCLDRESIEAGAASLVGEFALMGQAEEVSVAKHVRPVSNSDRWCWEKSGAS